ncbi:MAG TPA: ABC transporter permease [Nitrospira sp.]|jgi:osmoprotectant transport system permease protein|nr:ABC transporter permease [Nitrospira sp.]
MIGSLLHELLTLTTQHVVLVGVAMLFAAIIAIPLGILLTWHPAWRPLTLEAVNVVQTIPSLALFGFLIPLPLLGGIGPHTAIIALVLYALLPMLRNTVTGILTVDPLVRESATALGMTAAERLRQVELPLAAPTILAGVRIAAVTTIGTATIAAAIGAGGLGVLIFRGLAAVDGVLLLAGAIPAALMAIAADRGLEWVEQRWSRH